MAKADYIARGFPSQLEESSAGLDSAQGVSKLPSSTIDGMANARTSDMQHSGRPIGETSDQVKEEDGISCTSGDVAGGIGSATVLTLVSSSTNDLEFGVELAQVPVALPY